MAVLGGDDDTFALQQCVHLFGMAGGVYAAVQHLAFTGQTELGGLDLLDLGQKVAALPHFGGVGHDLSPCRGVLFVGETGTDTGAGLHQHGMSRGADGGRLHRRADHAVFAFFDVLQNTKYHIRILQIVLMFRQGLPL